MTPALVPDTFFVILPLCRQAHHVVTTGQRSEKYIGPSLGVAHLRAPPLPQDDNDSPRRNPHLVPDDGHHE